MRIKEYGSWALIAGGSEGIGASFARKLGAMGINLVLLARNPAPLSELADQLRQDCGIEVRTLSIDITAPTALGDIVALTSDIEIGLLICNAGAFHKVTDFLDQPAEAARAMIDLNIVAPTILAHHFGAGMRARRKGGMIFVGSLACMAGNAKVAVYAGAKSYLKIFAEGLWHELKPYGVDVLGLILGLTRTPAYERDGFDTDNPQFAMAEPDDAADEGLRYLSDGPIRIPPAYQEFLDMLSGLPRADAVSMLSAGIEAVTMQATDGG